MINIKETSKELSHTSSQDERVDAYYKALGRTDVENAFLDAFFMGLRENTNLFSNTTSLVDIGCGSGHQDATHAGERGVWITDLIQQFNPKAAYYGVDLYRDHVVGAQQQFKSHPTVDASNVIVAADGFDSDFKALFQYDESPKIFLASHVVYGAGEKFDNLIKNVNDGMGQKSLAIFIHMDPQSDAKAIRDSLQISSAPVKAAVKKFVYGGKEPSDIEQAAKKNGMGLLTAKLPVKLKFPKLDDRAIQRIIDQPNALDIPPEEKQFRLLLEHVTRTPLAELPNRQAVITAIVDKWLKPNNFALDAPVIVQVLTKNQDVDRVFKRGVERSFADATKSTGATLSENLYR